MFNNISKTIKVLSRIIFFSGIIASLIIAMLIFAKALVETSNKQFLILGFLFLIIGPAMSFALSYITFKFGKRIENKET